MKTKFTLFFTAIILTISFTSAQTGFQRLIGGADHDRCQTLFSTFDNGYIANGASLGLGVGSADAILIKTDSLGQVLWSKAYGTVEYDNSEYALETFDHNIICAGRSNLTTGSPTAPILFKTDSAGNLSWAKSYGGTSNGGFNKIIETADHGYAAVGYTADMGPSTDILFVRTDSNGDTLFTRAYGTIETEAGASIIELPDGGFAICGKQVTNPGPVADGVLLRTDASGNLMWVRQFGDSLYEEFTDIVRHPDNSGFYITGSTVTFGAGNFDIYLVKTDTTGSFLWSKTYGGVETDAAYDVHMRDDNSLVMSGYTNSMGYGHTRGDDSSNIFLMKTDDAGAVIWTEVYGDGLQDEGFHSAVANDGGYLVSGFTVDYLLNGFSQMMVIKTDSMGISGCHESPGNPIDSSFILPNLVMAYTQYSGIAISNITLTETVVAVIEDDACLFSDVNSISSKGNGLKLYPNPFNNYLEVSLDENTSGEIIVRDLLGKIIISERVEGKLVSISTENIPSGIYSLSIINSENEVKSSLIVKY